MGNIPTILKLVCCDTDFCTVGFHGNQVVYAILLDYRHPILHARGGSLMESLDKAHFGGDLGFCFLLNHLQTFYVHFPLKDFLLLKK